VSKTTRCLVAVAAILIAIATLLPLWRISLVAPQYPEGLGMQITMRTIRGASEFDLDNINHLNHYIGMRVIEPADMPELRYMSWIALAIAAAGLGAAALGRRAALYAWTGLFGAAGVVGMSDFWWRTYTFGHTLDFEHAAIQIPGLAYQPPILGVKQIANFTAASWPAAGGILIGFAAALTALAVWRSLDARAARPALGSPITRLGAAPTSAAA